MVTFILPADLNMNYQIFFKPPPPAFRLLGLARPRAWLGVPPSPLPGQLWEGPFASPDCPTLVLFPTSRSLILIVTEEKWIHLHMVLELGLSPKSPHPPWWASICVFLWGGHPWMIPRDSVPACSLPGISHSVMICDYRRGRN